MKPRSTRERFGSNPKGFIRISFAPHGSNEVSMTMILFKIINQDKRRHPHCKLLP
jgi:hypothetical protein